MSSSPYSKSVLVGTGVVFSILPIIAVGLRFYARTLSSAKLGLDDWIMLPAVVSSIKEAIHHDFSNAYRSFVLRME